MTPEQRVAILAACDVLIDSMWEFDLDATMLIRDVLDGAEDRMLQNSSTGKRSVEYQEGWAAAERLRNDRTYLHKATYEPEMTHFRKWDDPDQCRRFREAVLPFLKEST